MKNYNKIRELRNNETFNFLIVFWHIGYPKIQIFAHIRGLEAMDYVSKHAIFQHASMIMNFCINPFTNFVLVILLLHVFIISVTLSLVLFPNFILYFIYIFMVYYIERLIYKVWGYLKIFGKTKILKIYVKFLKIANLKIKISINKINEFFYWRV